MAEKDVYLKALTQSLSGGAMQALGVDGVDLAEALPTVLPAGELRVDTVWRQVNGQLLHLEFQTEREPTLYRFLAYDTRLAQVYRVPIRTVVLYHAGVTEAPTQLHLGVIQYQVENVYLANQDGDSALYLVAQHLATETWEPPDRLRLALALCMQTSDRDRLFGQTLELIPQVLEPNERDLVIAAIMALAESVLTDDEIDRLVKELTPVSKILEKIEQQGRQEGEQIGFQKGEQIGIHKGEEKRSREIARAMLRAGDSVEKVQALTGLTREVIEALRSQ